MNIIVSSQEAFVESRLACGDFSQLSRLHWREKLKQRMPLRVDGMYIGARTKQNNIY